LKGELAGPAMHDDQNRFSELPARSIYVEESRQPKCICISARAKTTLYISDGDFSAFGDERDGESLNCGLQHLQK
jgi:hypothetical protein